MRAVEMKPTINDTGFGYITIKGSKIKHDIVIRLSGEIKKRKKKLSKAVYGTSHMISLEEAKYLYQDGAERLIIGSGQFGLVELSQEAVELLEEAIKFLKENNPKIAFTSFRPGSDALTPNMDGVIYRAYSDIRRFSWNR